MSSGMGPHKEEERCEWLLMSVALYPPSATSVIGKAYE